MDIQKQVIFWKNGAEEELGTAQDLLKAGRYRQSLFFLHLSLEKLLKALVILKIKDFPPRIHNLSRLANIAEAELISQHQDNLADINEYNLESRYPGEYQAEIDKAECETMVTAGNEVFTCLMKTLQTQLNNM